MAVVVMVVKKCAVFHGTNGTQSLRCDKTVFKQLTNLTRMFIHPTDSQTSVTEEGRSEQDFHQVDAVLPRLTLPHAREHASFLWDG